MTRPMSPAKVRPSARGPNFAAILISFVAVSILYFNFQPTPVGADPDAGRSDIASVTAAMSAPLPPPLPEVIPESAPGGEGDTAGDAEKPGDAETKQAASSAARPAADPNVLQGRMALLMNLLMLERGCATLEKVSDYTATFFKQERIAGELSDEQLMQLKMRHQPFSVYMKWIVGGDKGRQILFVDGQNDNKLIVQLGGWKARLPALKLEPDSDLAMKESRYPITKAGILEMARLALDFRRIDLKQADGVRCQMIADQKFQERDCFYFAIEYDRPEISQTYRKSLMYLDKEWSVPLFVKNYTWAGDAAVAADKVDENTLIEFYTFTDVKFNTQMANSAFDRANEEYKFR